MGYKRLLCLSCKKPLVPWGKTSSGKKRYFCKRCGISRIFKKKTTDFFMLFREYVFWGSTYQHLADQSGYSIRYLQLKFQVYFATDPPVLPPIDQSDFSEAFLLLDGLWLKRGFVLMAYRQSRNLTILHISVVGREAATKIARDLKILKEIYIFTGVVSDGGTGIIKAVQDVFPHIPHQICLAHLHRDIISAIGRYPRDERIKELKALADHVWLIESREALKWWREQVQVWMHENNGYLKERRYDIDYNFWYVHRGARRAVSILQSLPHTSFKFLNHPLMPKTTNELEASFGHLGKRWLSHRGLKTEKWEQFMKWFVYFYNKDKLSDKKTKED
jgi:DNA-directed RNA polymerase subunit RPC12/RpoP